MKKFSGLIFLFSASCVSPRVSIINNNSSSDQRLWMVNYLRQPSSNDLLNTVRFVTRHTIQQG